MDVPGDSPCRIGLCLVLGAVAIAAPVDVRGTRHSAIDVISSGGGAAVSAWVGTRERLHISCDSAIVIGDRPILREVAVSLAVGVTRLDDTATSIVGDRGVVGAASCIRTRTGLCVTCRGAVRTGRELILRSAAIARAVGVTRAVDVPASVEFHLRPVGVSARIRTRAGLGIPNYGAIRRGDDPVLRAAAISQAVGVARLQH